MQDSVTAGSAASDDHPLKAEVRLLRLPTVAELRTSRTQAGNGSQATRNRNDPAYRMLVVVRLQASDGHLGWGECSALNEIGYSHESAQSSFDALTTAPRPSPTKLPMAAAALEMAMLDMRLRRSGMSLSAELGGSAELGATRTHVRAGAVLGLMSAEDSLAQAADLVDAGYQRIKVKISPEQIELVPTALRNEFPNLEIQVDANGSLGRDHLEQLRLLQELGVAAIEQPFAVDEVALSSELVLLSSIPIVADESAPTLAAAKELAAAKALSGISIKPPRVGGMSRALEMLGWATEEGLVATAGGMLESALGRHSLAAFSALEGLTLTGDLSPSRRWLELDPWPDLVMTGLDADTEAGMIVVPDGVGVAPLPDLDVLEDLTTQAWTGTYAPPETGL